LDRLEVIAMYRDFSRTGQRQTAPPRPGAAALELTFALIFVLIPLALMCVDYGRYAYYAIGVQNAARAGAEYAIMNPYPVGSDASWQSAVVQAARDEMTNQTGYSSAALNVMPSVTFDKNTGLPIITVAASYTGFTTVVNYSYAGIGIDNNPTLSATVVVRSIR
jgi:hypothetical protein